MRREGSKLLCAGGEERKGGAREGLVIGFEMLGVGAGVSPALNILRVMVVLLMLARNCLFFADMSLSWCRRVLGSGDMLDSEVIVGDSRGRGELCSRILISSLEEG